MQSGGFIVVTDKDAMDVVAIHDYLANHSHWSRGIPMERVRESINNSLNFGLFFEGKQVGYARVISDFATIAYLGDVYVLPEYRGQGLSKMLMAEVMQHPRLQGLRRWILLTSDAHGLYEKYGWSSLPKPELYMELHNPNVYK